uniref:Secreted protein n=1 Tax=Macrostomum lignano TaxID=282301 RepID=A0A1I8HB18_9PLAT
MSDMWIARLFLLCCIFSQCGCFNESAFLDDLNFFESSLTPHDEFEYAETDILAEPRNATRIVKRSTRANLCCLGVGLHVRVYFSFTYA